MLNPSTVIAYSIAGHSTADSLVHRNPIQPPVTAALHQEPRRSNEAMRVDAAAFSRRLVSFAPVEHAQRPRSRSIGSTLQLPLSVGNAVPARLPCRREEAVGHVDERTGPADEDDKRGMQPAHRTTSDDVQEREPAGVVRCGGRQLSPLFGDTPAARSVFPRVSAAWVAIARRP